jgi:hypothetical protein
VYVARLGFSIAGAYLGKAAHYLIGGNTTDSPGRDRGADQSKRMSGVTALRVPRLFSTSQTEAPSWTVASIGEYLPQSSRAFGQVVKTIGRAILFWAPIIRHPGLGWMGATLDGRVQASV